mmetsp:Transcript_79788/g.165819  ORF Transcript_79788/g.165819 Transcript_79788/m.165819 type:complete len:337 (+) Transcript_79788:114-1124(+)|eukprot:CAMPEP_0206452880 /NCGR_PEP_ID=MMETSP0324_2-20121206/20206_1 /ASSEMBLY_ACC=CAM_ASM_000836 /TAXON_ID=2866 /ORGANISM="Crypthecodinium cohnii, Strain Seligo" /LENGTH=336 /DNA_ID=CAMNT_0053923049 /DNA_START=196 /DNA_END=1206 /DNA_ORIENTATION=+
MNVVGKGRFYEDEFPTEEETVVVRVNRLDENTGAYVSLIEYGDKEGFIPLSEISKRRIRSMIKVLRIGTNEVCQVVSVDHEKGYINLSKKRVRSEDIAPKNDRYAKAKCVHGIMQHVAFANDIAVEDLCTKVAWPLNEKYGTAYDAFRKHVNGIIDVWKVVDFGGEDVDLSAMADKLKADIEKDINRKFVMAQVRLQAKCDVSCFGYEGIDAVKEALLEGVKDNKDISIQLIAHPEFAFSTMCSDKEAGVKALEHSLELVEKAITERGGAFALKAKPTFISTEKEDEDEDEEGGKAGDDDDSSGSSSSEEEQDDTMGAAPEIEALLNKKKAEKDED